MAAKEKTATPKPPKAPKEKIAPVSTTIAGTPPAETKPPVVEEAKTAAPAEVGKDKHADVTFIMAKGKTCGASVTKVNDDSLDLFLAKPFSRHVKGVKQGTSVGCYR